MLRVLHRIAAAVFFLAGATLVTMLFSMPNISSAAESSGNSTIISSDSKIVIVTDMFLPSTYQQLNTTFYLYNIGNDNATGVKVIPSSLIKQDGRFFSAAPSFIAPSEKLEVQLNSTTIEKGAAIRVDFIIKEELPKLVGYEEAVYNGSLQIIGDNFQASKIDVVVSFQYNPLIYVFFTMGGIAVAIYSGQWYTRRQAKDEILEKTHDDEDIISSINGHIRGINAFRNTIAASAWMNIFVAFADKKLAIDKHRDNIDLDPEAEAVKWFEIVDKQVRTGQFFEENSPFANNAPLPEILPPSASEKAEAYLERRRRILNGRIDKKIAEDKANIGKRLYAISTAVISILASIWGNATLHGNIGITLLVAFSIGFAAYRAQDILKILSPKKEEKEEKED